MEKDEVLFFTYEGTWLQPCGPPICSTQDMSRVYKGSDSGIIFPIS